MMPVFVSIVGWIGFTIVALGVVIFVVTSLYEREWRAAGMAFVLCVPILGSLATLLLLNIPFREWIVLGLIFLGGVTTLFILFPLGSHPRLSISGKQERIDERDAIFHRFYRLEPSTPEFEAYYRDHPEKFAWDENVRAMPELGHPGSKTYHPLSSPFQVATFDVTERITREIDWKPEPMEAAPVQATLEEFTRRVKGFAHYLGADLVGTTKLNPAYVYSHVGRSPGEWGDPIKLNHTHAIAIGVEMEHEMIRHAPEGPVTTESSFQYFEAAKIAMVVARYINRLGYEARAHVDGNYRVLCVPIAVDAGLGELGRLGLLITPEFGPRVRLSVVTTNLPLIQDNPITFGVQDFCSFCKKCATNCPSGAIALEEKTVYHGVEKWQSQQEPCYRFWRTQGTDCSICIKVCPYSHPRTLIHNLIRWVVRRNVLVRRLASLGDDLFYGRRPRTTFPLPDWHEKT